LNAFGLSHRQAAHWKWKRVEVLFSGLKAHIRRCNDNVNSGGLWEKMEVLEQFLKGFQK